MNIFIDTRMLYHSGIGTYIRNIVPFIIKKSPQDNFYLLGNKVSILKSKINKYTNAHIVEFNSPIYSLKEQFIIHKIIKEADFFWSPHYNIPLHFKGKLLVTIHDVNHLAMPHFLNGMHKKIYANYMFSVVKKKSEKILTVSNFSKKQIIKYLNIKNNQIEVIYNAVDPVWFNIKKKENPYPKKYFLCVGNVKPHKNITSLLKAFQAIKGNIDHDIIIIGKKNGFITKDDKVKNIAQKLGCRVHFTGYIDESLLHQWMLHAEALIFPSLYEGFGIPTLEAMASDCPVMCSNAASLPEVCGDAALYFDPYNPGDIADKIKLFIESKNLQRRLRKRGKIRASLFSWEDSSKKIINIINSIRN